MSVKLYKIDQTFKNSQDLLSKFLTVYSVCSDLKNPKNHLRPRLATILSYYVLKGYSIQTKNLILESEPKLSREHLNQINSELKKRGYLIEDKFNSRNRKVNKELLALKNYVFATESASPLLVVKFVKESV